MNVKCTKNSNLTIHKTWLSISTNVRLNMTRNLKFKLNVALLYKCQKCNFTNWIFNESSRHWDMCNHFKMLKYNENSKSRFWNLFSLFMFTYKNKVFFIYVCIHKWHTSREFIQVFNFNCIKHKLKTCYSRGANSF